MSYNKSSYYVFTPGGICIASTESESYEEAIQNFLSSIASNPSREWEIMQKLGYTIRKKAYAFSWTPTEGECDE